ncbi:MAG TPA: DAHL domain-containing protein [Nostocaceae cyanobacterium]|nr:DAHL domain-containing protein [Nostocaceae cyanobacterium]
MIKVNFFKLLFGLFAALILAFLATEAKSVDFKTHHDYHEKIIRLTQYDARINQDIIKTKYELLTSYDAMVNNSNELRDLTKNLEEIPGFINDDGKDKLKSLLLDYKTAIQEKNSLIDKFKSENAILKNSLNYLPVLIEEEILKKQSTNNTNNDLDNTLNQLLHTILLYNLNNDENLLAKIEVSIYNLSLLQNQNKLQEINDLTKLVITHTKIILDKKPRVNNLSQQLLQIPIIQRINALEKSYNYYHDQAVEKAEIFQFYTYCWSLLILGYVFYIFIEKISQANQRTINILESITDAFLALDHQWQITYLNTQAAQLFQNNPQHLLNRNVWKALPEKVRSRFYEEYQRAIVEKIPVNFEEYYEPLNIWLEVWVYPATDGLSIFFKDISQRKQDEATLKELNEDLESKVEERTVQLNQVVEKLKQKIKEQKQTEKELHSKAEELQQTLQELQQTQVQLVQSEKMSSLGQMVAGIAHEINNPVNFIHGNIQHAKNYIQDLLELVSLYQNHYPDTIPEIKDFAEEIDLEFVQEDLLNILSSMYGGTTRIQEIVISLRNFSRLDEADKKRVNIHEGLDSTLLILEHRLRLANKKRIQIIKEYGQIPRINCYASQINQVFMNVLSNAIDALEDKFYSDISAKDNHCHQSIVPTIWIITEINENNYINIRIKDNGSGIPEEAKQKLFDPFFTTKPVGKGTGLGLSISYKIVVEKHQGKLDCHSVLGEGTEFSIEIPIN